MHQIQSGQVIVDLCSVAKELVENSLDAGATSIGRDEMKRTAEWTRIRGLRKATDVRFKNQGLDSIEVQDNGSGIAPHNYEGLGLKHYTSKLSTYGDLDTLQTFGFRGEALSSLCALSDFTVITCLQSDVPRGTKLEFETSGKLKGTGVVASQKGTTVIVEGLFKNLPVRRRELERNIKREWGKVISLLNQYACVVTGVKFAVSQQPSKGKRISLFSTKGNATTRDNIINVFGAKTMNAMMLLDLTLEMEPTRGPGQKWVPSDNGGGTTTEIHVRGHVSRPAHGEGRQTPDRQLFYVNGRPCQLPQFAKVFNEVYRSYNASQSPFIFADIQLDTHLYDVNVSPDKRTIMLHDQGQMLDTLKENLVELFEKQDITVPIAQLSAKKSTPFKKLTVNRQQTPASKSTTGTGAGAAETHVPPPPPQTDGVDAIQAPASDSQEEDHAESDRPTPHSSNDTSQPKDSDGLDLLSRWVQRKKANALSPSGEESVGNEEHDIPEPELEGVSLGDGLVGEAEPGHAVALEEDAPPSTSGDTRMELTPMSPPSGRGQMRLDSPEPPIPALATPSRKLGARVNNIPFERPLKRAPQETATITIGDDTVTSLVGSPLKRQKLEKDSGRSSRAKDKAAAPLPSFGGRLSQMFAASGPPNQEEMELVTETADASDDYQSPRIDEEGEEEEEEDDDDDEEPSSAESKPREAVEDKNSGGVSEGEVDENEEEEERSPPASDGDLSEEDEDYVDEEEERVSEDLKVQELIQAAEEAADNPTEDGQRRGQAFARGGGTRRKESTFQYIQRLKVDSASIERRYAGLMERLGASTKGSKGQQATEALDAVDAEEKLSLIISKMDFARMKVVGQFNLGFVLAVRAADGSGEDSAGRPTDDELFIIDQHASDEKYNFERLQASTVVQSQRLVRPKRLELTAVEEEIVLENREALETNGFIVTVDQSGAQTVGSRCQLVSLPLSRETTFSLEDLEELISLLGDRSSATTVPRPSRVRKMFAMRACRSSIMIGKALSQKQMEKVVRHMGEMEKPWNCPHGRPTMRHLAGLGAWDERGWIEGDGLEEPAAPTDWSAFLQSKR